MDARTPGAVAPQPLDLARLRRRGFAWLIDFSLFHGGFLAALELLGLAGHLGEVGHAFVTKRYGDAVLKLAPVLVLALVCLVAWIAYRVTGIAMWGSSLGKRLVGVRVVDASDGRSPPGWGKAWARWAVPQAMGLVPVPGAGGLAYAWVLHDTQRRGLHDLAAGTIVVRRRPTAHRGPAGQRGAAAPLDQPGAPG